MLNKSCERFREIVDEWYKSSKDQKDSLQKELIDLKQPLLNQFYTFIVTHEKQKTHSYDPTMVFIGSVEMDVVEGFTKLLLHKDYPPWITTYNQLVPRNNIIKGSEAKRVFKKAFDHVYGVGSFDATVKNNKRKRSHKMTQQLVNRKMASLDYATFENAISAWFFNFGSELKTLLEKTYPVVQVHTERSHLQFKIYVGQARSVFSGYFSLEIDPLFARLIANQKWDKDSVDVYTFLDELDMKAGFELYLDYYWTLNSKQIAAKLKTVINKVVNKQASSNLVKTYISAWFKNLVKEASSKTHDRYKIVSTNRMLKAIPNNENNIYIDFDIHYATLYIINGKNGKPIIYKHGSFWQLPPNKLLDL